MNIIGHDHGAATGVLIANTGADTLMATGSDVVLAPALSTARAVSVYEPAATPDHCTVYGEALEVPISVVPS